MSKISIGYIVVFLFHISLCDLSEKDIRKLMQSLYGENKEITGEYEKDLSVSCNNGIFVGKKKDDVISFKGIPFAKPPIGELRWKNPILAEDNNKIYEAYYFGKAPIQTEWIYIYGSYYPKSEDCLYLNVWVNTKDTSTDKTVLVFIHGGSYGWGAASDPLYDGHNLVQKYPDIILVSIEYRLGIFGFINFSSVQGGENYKTSNNLGLLDQICALKWIQKNIKNFGGDPNKVTVFGQSSGGGSISLLPLIDGTDGLFKRIISQSGPISLTFSPNECERLIKKLLEKSGASKMEDLVSLSEEKLIEINKEISDYDNFPERNGGILPVDLYEAYKSGKGKNIDMLFGSNNDEVRNWINTMGGYTKLINGKFLYIHGLPLLYENDLKKLSEEDKEYVNDFMKLQNGKKVWKITEFYNEVVFRVPINKQAEYHSDAGGNSYVYLWKYPGEDETLGALHGIELSYIFNNLDQTLYTGNKVNVELANEVQDMWVNFAKTGNPSTKKNIWEHYDSNTRKTMILDETIKMEENYKSEQREIIEHLLKYYFNGSYVGLSYNVPQFYKIIAQIGGALAIVSFVLYKLFK